MLMKAEHIKIYCDVIMFWNTCPDKQVDKNTKIEENNILRKRSKKLSNKQRRKTINKYINEVTKFQEHLDNAKNLKIKIKKEYLNYQKSKIENQNREQD